MLSLTALALWLVTAALGITELLGWRRSASKPPPLAYRHASTALTGLALWTGFVVTGAHPWHGSPSPYWH